MLSIKSYGQVKLECIHMSQWNLIVGDLFKVKDDYGKYGNMAQELITWLRSKMQVLALLHDIQMATMGKTLAIIRAVLT